MCGDSISMSKDAKKREQDYRAESDFNTLKSVEDIRADPDRHGRAMAHGRKQISSMTRAMRGSKMGRMAKRAPVR